MVVLGCCCCLPVHVTILVEEDCECEAKRYRLAFLRVQKKCVSETVDNIAS